MNDLCRWVWRGGWPWTAPTPRGFVVEVRGDFWFSNTLGPVGMMKIVRIAF